GLGEVGLAVAGDAAEVAVDGLDRPVRVDRGDQSDVVGEGAVGLAGGHGHVVDHRIAHLRLVGRAGVQGAVVDAVVVEAHRARVQRVGAGDGRAGRVLPDPFGEVRAPVLGVAVVAGAARAERRAAERVEGGVDLRTRAGALARV